MFVWRYGFRILLRRKKNVFVHNLWNVVVTCLIITYAQVCKDYHVTSINLLSNFSYSRYCFIFHASIISSNALSLWNAILVYQILWYSELPIMEAQKTGGPTSEFQAHTNIHFELFYERRGCEMKYLFQVANILFSIPF